MQSRNRPNIYDIAKEAGVSISMVSRVMNNSGAVAKAKRERIVKLLAKHQYTPNPAARSLARHDHNTFGALLTLTGPEYAQLFANRILTGISEWCNERHRNLMLMWHDRHEMIPQLFTEASQKIDGVFIIDMRFDAATNAHLREIDLPFVLINEPAFDETACAVLTDNFAGGQMAARHLLENGHRAIALISGDLDLPSGRDRQRGNLAALAEAGMAPPASWIIDAKFSPDRARQAVRQLYATSPWPSALIVASDLMAFAVIDELREMGLQAPTDVSVIGFDDSLIAPLISPPLTTIAQPLVQMGHEAAALLASLIAEPGTAEQRVLPVSLRQRHSVRNLKSPGSLESN